MQRGHARLRAAGSRRIRSGSPETARGSRSAAAAAAAARSASRARGWKQRTKAGSRRGYLIRGLSRGDVILSRVLLRREVGGVGEVGGGEVRPVRLSLSWGCWDSSPRSLSLSLSLSSPLLSSERYQVFTEEDGTRTGSSLLLISK